MKRKAEEAEVATSNGQRKRAAIEADSFTNQFREDLFSPKTLEQFKADYASSEPYKYAVVSDLINDTLLRSVRSEILENIHFTPKETDIYKIHQSGDLANLDGLPEAALEKLPSLLQLRDALYSHDFRRWLSTVTGAGDLSGTKTDMAVNVYVPGCHLICHDDVIGSRRVSYILYLTNPDIPWKAEWGGALRLYPTENHEDKSGKPFILPNSEWSRSIPPAWNQLSFFAVQPGQSFHDVEEVYRRQAGESGDDGGRFRMAISGWFHIPQEGEEGFEPGLEEKLADRSSLQQLQGKADRFDRPMVDWTDPEKVWKAQDPSFTGENSLELTESDLEFLIKYMNPNYLTPDTVDELNEMFAEESMAQLSNFLNAKFAERLKSRLQDDSLSSWQEASLSTSRPPHKHRYHYTHSQPSLAVVSGTAANPLELVLNELLPSLAFRKWLSLVSGLTLRRCSVIARRFRRGLDYELAHAYEGEDPQLEYTLCVTPTLGWGGGDSLDQIGESNGAHKTLTKGEEDNVGGYEIYMAGDDEEDDGGSDDGVEVPTKIQSQTGAGERRSASQKKADPAIYKAATDDEDDGIIVSNPANWNMLNIVLRDKGTLRFVKYVSQSAPGDRWDFAGLVEVEPDDDLSVDEDVER